MTKLKEQQSQPALCPKFEFTFSILGKKWNGLIIEALLESQGSMRFIDLSKSIDGVSDRVLTERLKELEELDIIERLVEGDKVRPGYRLSEKGKALNKVMKEIQNWADVWVCSEECRKH